MRAFLFRCPCCFLVASVTEQDIADWKGSVPGARRVDIDEHGDLLIESCPGCSNWRRYEPIGRSYRMNPRTGKPPPDPTPGGGKDPSPGPPKGEIAQEGPLPGEGSRFLTGDAQRAPRQP